MFYSSCSILKNNIDKNWNVIETVGNEVTQNR